MKQVIQIKPGRMNQLLGFFAVFIMLMSEFIGALYLTMLNKTIPIVIYVILHVMGYIVGGYLLYFAIVKLAKMTDVNSVGGNMRSGFVFVMNIFLGVGGAVCLNYALPKVLVLQRDSQFFIALGVMVVGVILLGIFGVTAWLIARNDVQSSQYFQCFFKGIGLFFTNPTYGLTNAISILSIGSIIVYLERMVWPSLFLTKFSPLLVVFYKSITSAALLGMVALFLVRVMVVLYSDKAVFQAEKKSPLGFILAGLCFVGVFVTILPKSDYGVVAEYETIIATAEAFRTEDNLYLCGNAYKKAYALIKAYNGYLLDMQVQKDKKATPEQITRVKGEADALFRQAYDFYPNSGKIYYLDALRNAEKSPESAVAILENAKKYDPNFSEINLLILSLTREADQMDIKKSEAKSLITKGVYIDLGNLNSMSFKDIEKNLETIDEYTQVCLENITTIAYDYYNNQLYSEAMVELQGIKEILPKDIVTNYLIAMTDLELKADNKVYTTAVEAAQTILSQYPDEKWAQDLYSGVTLRAGNQNVMDVVLEESYQKNPNDLDIAEQYAFSILKKNYNSAYYEVTQQAEVVIDKILEKDSERWFAIYCKSLIELYKGEYESSISHINAFSDLIVEDKSLFSIYDELYNIYVYKYAKRMTIEVLAAESLNNSEHIDAFTFHYIMGAYSTMLSDFDATITHLNEAIKYNPSFSKLYYMMGNAHMEYGYRNADPASYVIAEEFYTKSIQIFESDPYAWFALGHAYKNQQRLEEALSAFQKTLTFMPAEDHQSDYFGVSIHSTYQIAEIQGILSTKEAK